IWQTESLPQKLETLNKMTAEQNETYEEKTGKLNKILARLDDPDTPIDTLADDVKQGTKLIKELEAKLREVESEVESAFEELEDNDDSGGQ
ncbi:exodeoxyribonuclease VII small subunit, partial [bacterium]|nr:exodeoxyribonuclease VII small subunit [bacterium]